MIAGSPIKLSDSEKDSFQQISQTRTEYLKLRRPQRIFSESKKEIPSFTSRRAVVRRPAPFVLPLTVEALWGIAESAVLPVTLRSRCLAELIARNDARVSSFVLQQLNAATDDPPWRNELLFAAEHVEIAKENRTAYGLILLRYAREARGAANPSTIKGAWAALRKYASITGVSGAPELLAFLGPDNEMATRQVALQCIQRIFLHSPPNEGMLQGSLNPLAIRVSELVAKYLDLDWLTPGDNSSLAMNALYATASMIDPKLPDYSRTLVGFKRPRLVRMATRFLQELNRSWSANVRNLQSAPMMVIRASLAALEIQN